MINLSEFTETLIGEEPHSGEPCILIRITGCNLDCKWCDTPNRYRVKESLKPEAIAERAAKTGKRWALITGGEPLLCEETPQLIREILKKRMFVLLETNGTFSLADIPAEVYKSVDIKTPSSGHVGSFYNPNINLLTRKDIAKFVIANRTDFDWAIGEIERLGLTAVTQVILSPVWRRMAPRRLAAMILESGMPLRLSVQLHKILKIP